MTITWRPARVDDAPAVAAVLRAGDELASGHDTLSEQSMREELSGPFWDLTTDTFVAETNGQVVAFGGVIAPPHGGVTLRARACVHPEHRAHGLGTQLLSGLVDRAGAMHAACGAREPWSLRHGSDDNDPSTGALLAAHGFEPVRFWYAMDRDLDNIAPLRQIQGLQLRAVAPGEAGAIYEAHRAAFADHWGSQDRGFDAFNTRVVRASAFRPALSRIAVDDAGVVAGYALAFVEADPTMIIFALIGTRREWRGRGVASELVRRSLGAARDVGLTSASLLVDGDSPTGAVGVYERLGFRITSRATTYALEIG